jgi:hypothetical protein
MAPLRLPALRPEFNPALQASYAWVPSPSWLRAVFYAVEHDTATPSSLCVSGRPDGGRLGAGNLGLPPSSKDSAEGMDASAESAWIRKADP